MWLVYLALLTPAALAADVAGDLAARVHARLEPNRAVRVVTRNLSSLGPKEAAEAQRRIEQALTRDGAQPPVEVRVTLSENLDGPLWVAEAAGHVVLIPAPALPPAFTPVLEKKLLWRQEAPILDVAMLEGGALLILGPTRVVRSDSPRPAALTGVRPSRDPRGRLLLDQNRWTAYLPGVVCRGTLALDSVECLAGDQPWPLGPGLAARLEPGRNYFIRPGAPPFFSAAFYQGGWVFAGVDGHLIHGLAGEDIATVRTSCGERVLAAQQNSLQAYEIAAGQAAPSGDPLVLAGSVTALWPLPDASSLAVIRHSRTGRYEAYRVAMACGG